MTRDERSEWDRRHQELDDFGVLYDLSATIANRLPGWWQSHASRLSSRERHLLADTVWNTRVLSRTVNARQSPHAAVLLGPAVERLLVVPVGRDRYLVGALAPWGADPRHDYPRDPQAPPTAVVTHDAEQAAETIKAELLPSLRARIASLDPTPRRRIDTAASSATEPHVRVGRDPLFDLAVAYTGENTPQPALDLLANWGFESAGPGRLSLYDGDIALARRAVQSLRAAGVVVHADLADENSLADLATALKAVPYKHGARHTTTPTRLRPLDPPPGPTAPRRR
ncbi:hypothetical protein [Embleya sp. NPDC059259]|uniref:hypothetical protein n=1 Tax=unclassified Embleya TaxID=2699296 RepID=UPI00369B65AD